MLNSFTWKVQVVTPTTAHWDKLDHYENQQYTTA